MATIWEPPLQEDGRSHILLHTASNLRTSILELQDIPQNMMPPCGHETGEGMCVVF